MFNDFINTVCFIIARTVYLNSLKLFCLVVAVASLFLKFIIKKGFQSGTMIEIKFDKEFVEIELSWQRSEVNILVLLSAVDHSSVVFSMFANSIRQLL